MQGRIGAQRQCLLSGTCLGEESATCVEKTGTLLKTQKKKKEKEGKKKKRENCLKPLEVGLQTLSLPGHRLRATVVEERKSGLEGYGRS